MSPFYERDGITIYVGDNRDVLPHIGPVHAVVTDPPSGISFMGKEWDSNKGGRDQWIAWLAETLRGVSDAMLPGAHALIWALPRTSGWTSMAIEDAGMDVRDCITHLFGSGFPKSHDVSKAIDKMAGAERALVERIRPDGKGAGQVCTGFVGGSASPRLKRDDLAATPAAEQWQGWGTALKPAAEFWYLARKPFKGTVAANVLAHGTGVINVDACRIEGQPPSVPQPSFNSPTGQVYGFQTGEGRNGERSHATGRWPANVILDEDAAAMLDAQSGERKSGTRKRERIALANRSDTYSGFDGCSGKVNAPDHYGDTGGASRFFYVAKASRRERNAGLEGMPEREQPNTWGDLGAVEGNPRKPNTGHVQRVQNHHPTVKPLALMRYLIQMITPPGGTVLDPFMGSGSTLVAAAELGFDAIGIELSEEYAEIAARRVDHAIENRDPQLVLEGIA